MDVTIHHACPSCGRHLSRVRAPADPVYGLAVVVCPGCGEASVRRRDPMVAGYRAACKAGRAGLAVLIQHVVVCSVVLLSVLLIANTAYSSHADYGHTPVAVLLFHPSQLRPENVGPELLILMVFLAGLALFAGVWTRSALAHLNGWWVLAAATAAPVGFLLSFGVLFLLWDRLGGTGVPWGDAETLDRVPEILTAGGMFGVFMAAGFPLGRFFRTMWGGGRDRRWRRLRRKQRRLRDDR